MNAIAARLTKDHQELDALLRCLVHDADAPMGGTLRATWTSFETKLIRHVQVEEECLLPLLEASDAAEAARIRLEHARIRDVLTELGIAVELYTLREANIAELITLLEEHAKHENSVLYPLLRDLASTAVEQLVGEILEQGVALGVSSLSNLEGATKLSHRRARP